MIPVSNKIGFGDEMGPVATDLHTESMTECEAKEEVNMLMDQSNIKIIHIQASKSLDCLPVVRNYTNNVKRIVSIRPPIDLYKLKVIEKAFNPPDIEVLHELYFNPKMKLSTEMMRRLCRIDDLNSEETNVYWRHLATEIQALKNEKGLNSEHFPILCITLEEIKNMLLHLYPKSMILHDQLVPLLDSEFLVQQLTYGALDIDGLTQILGETLKKNCAPKRDALVERIIKLGSSINGDWLGMLRACLELMELMKYVCLIF